MTRWLISLSSYWKRMKANYLAYPFLWFILVGFFCFSIRYSYRLFRWLTGCDLGLYILLYNFPRLTAKKRHIIHLQENKHER